MTVYTLKHSSFYSKSRPKPSVQLVACIIRFLGQKLPANLKTSKWDLCLDAGCGSGQCTQLLSPYFNCVVGTDLHENQIEEARNNVRLSNVMFLSSPAEKLQAENNSADLVTCGQSLHWFNSDKFYPEVRRVLKLNGVLAAFGYPNIPTVSVEGKEGAGMELTNHLKSAYQHKYLKQYSIPKLKVVDSSYVDLDFPFDDFTRIDGIKTLNSSSVGNLEDYVQAWSDYHRCFSREPESANEVLELFRMSVGQSMSEQNLQPDDPITMTFHNFLIMGRKK